MHGQKTLATRATGDKCSSGSGIKNENISKKELAGELHKSIIRNLNKRKVYSPFMDNIWGADLADRQLISKFNKRFRYVIDIYSKYAWVLSLKDMELQLLMLFKNLKESNRKAK